MKPGWASLRFSIGFIGIVMPLPSMPSFGQFLRHYYLLKPPDILVIEWMHGDWDGGIRAEGANTFTRYTLAQLRGPPDPPSYAVSIPDFVAKVTLFLLCSSSFTSCSCPAETHCPMFGSCDDDVFAGQAQGDGFIINIKVLSWMLWLSCH